MTGFDPDALALTAAGAWHLGKPPGTIAGFCFDARRIRPGECFVALSGGARDGHEFVGQAASAGAVAVLVEHPVDAAIPQLVVEDSLAALGTIAASVRRGFTHPVIGITGSCGKTSTKEMLRLLLGEDRTHATAGNWNNRIGVPMTLFGLEPANQDFAVIEAGINQPGEMHCLGEMIRADLTLFTNVGPAHLELLGSTENVAGEKAQLAEWAVAGSPVILPATLMEFSAFRRLSDRAIVLAGSGEALPLGVRRIVRYELQRSGPFQILRLTDGDLETTCTIASSSAGIATNAALAMVAAHELGLPDADIRERIERWRPDFKRGRIARRGAQTFYIDCYNANPVSMLDALVAFSESIPADLSRCYVLGAMNELGEDAYELHRRVAEKLPPRAGDRLCCVGPQRLVAGYLDGACAAGWGTADIQVVDSSEKLNSFIAEFEGALFFKGSRSYALETLLPADL